MKIMYWFDPNMQKPYALYIHGFGSSAKSGTKSSLGRSLDSYEWLSPEITHDPYESLAILNEWAKSFQPALIAGTSMGGLLAIYVDSPNSIKVAINPSIEIERVLRKKGYGRHKYLQEREDGAKEFIIDEPMIQRFIEFRKEHIPILGVRNIALFSTEDELIGHEGSKKNASIMEQLGYEVLWGSKFGHLVMNKLLRKLKRHFKIKLLKY